MISYVFMLSFMESEHSGIFRVELVTKNVVLGSSGTHFMQMRVKQMIHLVDRKMMAAFFNRFYSKM